MSLDIAAYRKLVPAPDQPIDADNNPVDWHNFVLIDPACNANEFRSRAVDVAKGVYSWAEKLGFSAGSYSGYNDWRDELAELAGYPAVKRADGYRNEHANGAWEAASGPFWELINFSDCEGVIGPAVSAKLAKDFADFQDNVGARGYFSELYGKWRKAFEMAADGGCVDFR